VELAYAVGLMATDGNLGADRRHLSFVSRDRDLVETLRGCLRLTAQARAIRTPNGGTLYRVQWSNRILHDWFGVIGLMPAKSLRLGALGVPEEYFEEYFADFFRGCVDGDGSVLLYTDQQHAGEKADYVYERLYVSLVSASLAFVEWIQKTIQRLVGVAGALHRRIKPGHRPIWTLRLRQGQLHTDPSLDVPFAGRALPPTKARQGREVPWATRLGVETPSRATTGRLAIQC
jgi:hypothetical protein